MDARARVVIVVDDEPLVLWTARKLLEGAGYSVRCYSSGEALLEDPSWPGAAVAVVDVGLPGIDGRELARAIRSISPGTRTIHMTGDADSGDLPKERLVDELVSAVGAIVGNGHA